MMKRALTLAVAMIGFILFSYSQKEYKMWETIYIKPKPGMIEELNKGLAEHNKKFHAEDPYRAHVWQIHSGKHEGTYFWAMGPTTFTALDDRPGEGAHDDDWDKNITPYVEDVYGLQYWKLNEELSWSPEDAPFGKVVWTSFYLQPFEKYRFKEMLKKVNQVYKEKNYGFTMEVYEAEFDNIGCEDMVIEWGFDKWSWFDRDRTFVKDYEEIHGKGSWTYFMEEFKDVVKKVDDALAEYLPELSSPMQ